MSAAKQRKPVTRDERILQDLHTVFGGTIVLVDQRIDDVAITTVKYGDVVDCVIVLDDGCAEGFNFQICPHFLDVRKAAYAKWSAHEVSKAYKPERSNVVPFTGSVSQTAPTSASDNAVAATGLADLEAMTHPGGLVGDLVDWIVSSSERPVRFLALAACLPFVGALMGRHYSGYRDCRSNHYTLGIMESGGGKDHARKQIKRLMMESSIIQTFSGPGKFMSASALRNAVLDKPSCFCLMDEFGGTMRQMMDRKAGIHNQMIRDELLMMWSTSDTFYEGAAYASTSAVKIFNPNLCFYGTSTPDDFWQSVTGLNSTDGLLPRMLLFNVPYDAPPRVVPARDVKGCPQTIVEACERLAQSCGGKSKIRRSIHNGSEQTDAISVPIAPEAIDALEEFKQYVDGIMGSLPQTSKPIVNRSIEHAVKLALTVAVATDPDRPQVTAKNMVWAQDLAWHATTSMIDEVKDRVADNQREAFKKTIMRHIRLAGDKGISEGKLAERCGAIDKRTRTEILDDLVLSGQIESRLNLGRGRPGRRLHLKDVPDAD